MYDYDRRTKVADAEDVRPLLDAFRRGVASMERKWAELNENQEDSMTPVRALVFLPGAFDVLQRTARTLFLGILQQYAIPSAADRKLIEKASKEFSKTRIQRPKREKALEALRAKVEEYQAFADAAERVLRKGVLHTNEGSETTTVAGCFTLVNTGGFTSSQMADVVKVVEKAAAMIKAKGFSRICYGTIQVTNTVSSSSRVLAFYHVSKDELFVRGNLKGKQGPALDTIIHELGHRMHLKFLKSKDKEIKGIYDALARGEDLALQEALKDKTNWPKPGDTIQEGKTTYVVEKVELNRRYDYVVHLHRQEDPLRKATMPLRAWLSEKGGKASTFVSAYAKTNPAENFAEMFARYVEGTLPGEQVRLLETVL